MTGLRAGAATMRAVLLKGHGGFEQLEFRDDVPIPEPAAGEVLVRIGAAGVNNTDINTRTGWYSRAVSEGTTAAADAGWTGALPQFPRIQGADACGTIAAVGPGVSAQRVGERVLIEPVFRMPGEADRRRAIYFGSERDGAFAEFACVPAVHAYGIDSGLTDAQLASFPCSYSAAENMLTRLQLRAGETVLVTGASGGVGSAAVQLAKRRGATVLGLAGATKAAAVAALGATRVLERDTALPAALGCESVDAVVDVVGGARFGAIGGPTVALDLRTLYLKDLTLSGCTVLEDGVFANLVGYIERGEIRPVVAGVHPLKDIVSAQQAFLQKRHTGKIVLIP
jgi:NADPH:quinone reductase-like Zn-dependent oxidoreductase